MKNLQFYILNYEQKSSFHLFSIQSLEKHKLNAELHLRVITAIEDFCIHIHIHILRIAVLVSFRWRSRTSFNIYCGLCNQLRHYFTFSAVKLKQIYCVHCTVLLYTTAHVICKQTSERGGDKTDNILST